MIIAECMYFFIYLNHIQNGLWLLTNHVQGNCFIMIDEKNTNAVTLFRPTMQKLFPSKIPADLLLTNFFNTQELNFTCEIFS